MTKHTRTFGSLDGRTALVTGAAVGIGMATAVALGDAGATVLVHARSTQAAVEAARALRDESPKGTFTPVHADLESLAGVHELANQVREGAPNGLHVLINNAGAAFSERKLSPDGVERTIAINHLAVAALTDDLLDLLTEGAKRSGQPSRVVNLSSFIHKKGKAVTDWTYPEKFKQMSAYSDAKLLNLIYSYALAAQLDKTTVTVNAADPGQVKTGFGKKAGGFMGLIMKAMGPMLASPAKGALSSVAIATDPELGANTAGYVTAGKLTDSSKSSRDATIAKQVWTQTRAKLDSVRN
jgi:NAD(P)-dependent dehydrogenase (short-subunit alcohol dehydrogenase family)